LLAPAALLNGWILVGYRLKKSFFAKTVAEVYEGVTILIPFQTDTDHGHPCQQRYGPGIKLP